MKFITRDIEGCFTNMPKEAIKFGLRERLKDITRTHGYTSITVPYKDSERCEFNSKKRVRIWKIPFETLLDIMEFALDNTYIADLKGDIWKQNKGIPMGDPHSPGMCIGACGWMEHEWMQSLSQQSKRFFRATRYMDDILLGYAECGQFNAQAFLEDFDTSECYWQPMRLEEGSKTTFLETTFYISENNECR